MQGSEILNLNVVGSEEVIYDKIQTSLDLFVPMIIKNHCIYVGKIIVQKDATTAYSVESAFV